MTNMPKCDNCGKSKDTKPWVGEGSVMDFVHGNYMMWCELCMIKAQLKNAKKIAKRIPILEKKLKKLSTS